MSHSFDLHEPLPDHLADTGPVQAIRNRRANATSRWQRAIGLVFLLGATGLTLAAMLLMLSPTNTSVPDNPPPTRPGQEEPLPTQAPVELVLDNDLIGDPVENVTVLPTLDPQTMATLLNAPVAPPDARPGNGIEAIRDIFNPFTIIPERTRSEVEQYTIVSGDTIFSIAERYGLRPETIVWGNDHSIVEGLRPGRVINILPVDGVYYQVLNDDETIAAIAQRFAVDPYTIIDSEFNDFFGKRPEDTLPSGTWVVVPGGQREQITWNPVVQRVAPGANGSQGAISFAPGEPGSCGLVTNPGGTGWVPPLSGYQWIRGFSGVHSGVDLSAPVGTPVQAANGGAVIFAGWSSWGYGYTVVLAHGPFTTLYGHLSAINVGCAQYVSAGSTIGAVGSSGNSSGPHLHFEIRYQDVPQDPTYTLPF